MLSCIERASMLCTREHSGWHAPAGHLLSSLTFLSSNLLSSFLSILPIMLANLAKQSRHDLNCTLYILRYKARYIFIYIRAVISKICMLAVLFLVLGLYSGFVV
jgi:hypothetical protein